MNDKTKNWFIGILGSTTAILAGISLYQWIKLIRLQNVKEKVVAEIEKEEATAGPVAENLKPIDALHFITEMKKILNEQE